MIRFISTCGCPKIIVSNKFISAKSGEVKWFVTSKRITWNFNLDRSSWLEGFYETRYDCKIFIEESVTKTNFNYIEFPTRLQETEFVINSRPLTFLDEDYVKENLSPNHKIHGRNISSHCDEEISSINVMAKDARNASRHTDILFKHFIKRFKTNIF